MVTTSGYRRGRLPARSAVVAARVPDRPAALPAATALFVLTTVPFLLLAGAALALPIDRWLEVTGQWLMVDTGQRGYRVLGGVLLAPAIGYLLLAAGVGRGRAGARTGVAVATAIYDATLFMVLLADPRPWWLVAGGAVLVGSLAGVVLSYQPEVDRYLADRAV